MRSPSGQAAGAGARAAGSAPARSPRPCRRRRRTSAPRRRPGRPTPAVARALPARTATRRPSPTSEHAPGTHAATRRTPRGRAVPVAVAPPAARPVAADGSPACAPGRSRPGRSTGPADEPPCTTSVAPSSAGVAERRRRWPRPSAATAAPRRSALRAEARRRSDVAADRHVGGEGRRWRRPAHAARPTQSPHAAELPSRGAREVKATRRRRPPGHRRWRPSRSGSPGRTRTSDQSVNSRSLYRLSYRGTRALIAEAPGGVQCRALTSRGGPRAPGRRS